MQFRTQYNYVHDKKCLDHVSGVSETDGSQNETLSQLIRRFTAQGLVIPPAQFQPETEEETEQMLNGELDDITQNDDFDLADVSEALAEASQIVSNLRDKEKQASSAPVDKKQQEEPKKAADAANAAPQTSDQ